ncbi:GSCOCG00008965001-RA-CDS [Cotesia congregata]|nr:GSCOCG00008965001-RA-CDS [Cotesia congregata]
MAEEKRKIEFVDGPCRIKPRKFPAQNIVLRLRRRETIGCQYPGTQVLVARQFYQNVFPNFTVVNVEKPPCFLRKFSPDGRFLVAFSADQTSIEVYKYEGASAAAKLLVDCKGEREYIGHKNDDKSFRIRNNIFHHEQLNRECSLFTDDGRYVIVGSAKHIADELRPHFYQIYTNNEALTPNPRSPLEDYTLHLIDLKSGKFCDYRRFLVDKIYLSHNQGLYLYKDILAVLSVQHQTIHIFQILDGMFIEVRTIGRFCLEDESYLLASAYPNINTRPYKDTMINTLKHKLLIHLYKRAAYISSNSKDPYELRRFYQYFDQFEALRMWKMQLLDTNHILVRYASEEVATLQTTDPNAHPALLVVYNMVSAKVIAAYDNASLHMQTQYGGLTEATKRLLSQLPICAQSYSSSPYLDLSLFCYDDKWVSMMERPKACAEHPIRFYARDSGLLKFRLHAGMLGRTTPVVARRLVAFTFHPTDPFAISVQRTNAEYIVSFHVRHD